MADSSDQLLLLLVVGFAALAGWLLYSSTKKDKATGEVSSEPKRPASGDPALGATRWIVRVAEADGAREVAVELPAVVGRSSSSDICVRDAQVSGYHARLVSAGPDSIEIVDLGSRNGTLIGDVKIDARVITAGETFRVGSTELTFVAPTSAG
jgi:hypothetical protein